MSAQGSDEWLAERVGKITASKIGALVTPGWKRASNAAARAYIDQLVAERLTRRTTEIYVTPHMEWGVLCEHDAVAEYEWRTGEKPTESGFIEHAALPNTGASPDRLIGQAGGLEVKCPDPKTHLALLEGGEIRHEWLAQVHWNIECAGARWWDFASYDPRFPAALQMHLRRIERDDEILAALRAVVAECEAEIAGRVTALLNQDSTGLEPAPLLVPKGGPVEGAAV